ncbi:unnamed protein product [Linum trigynum]|uniref:Uncharacterized protein n=1 Tax=Linum trigynum TaxID=586398 RepID=A0AAV2F5I3_9ROSI
MHRPSISYIYHMRTCRKISKFGSPFIPFVIRPYRTALGSFPGILLFRSVYISVSAQQATANQLYSQFCPFSYLQPSSPRDSLQHVNIYGGNHITRQLLSQYPTLFNHIILQKQRSSTEIVAPRLGIHALMIDSPSSQHFGQLNW